MKTADRIGAMTAAEILDLLSALLNDTHVAVVTEQGLAKYKAVKVAIEALTAERDEAIALLRKLANDVRGF